jgi:3-oxoacyl-[acyl-carrier protein] reductase
VQKYDFTDKRVLITGGSKGIGKATAMQFALSGARVALLARTKVDLEDVATEIASVVKGKMPLVLVGDVSNYDQMQACFEQVQYEWGGLDILVNSAGINNPKGILETSIDEWCNVIETNLTGVFICCKLASQMMAEQQHGNIINVSSVAAQYGGRSPQYSASKVGVEGITKSLAREMAKFHVRVNAIAPAGTETEFSKKYWCEDKRNNLVANTIIGRIAMPDEVAEPILFLASNAASYITGSTLQVNGGILLA